jgi:hypothetical protein
MTRREVLALSIALTVSGDSIESRDAQLTRAMKLYWSNTESEAFARRARVASANLAAAIERAGTPEGWKICHQMAIVTSHCRTGKRDDKDFWCQVRSV